MSVLILTGPPAAGKNRVAPLIARERERCAVIDVDQVRWMILQPHAAPWEGEEGKRQCIFGVENACILARRFVDAGYDVVILDFIWPYTIDIYHQSFTTDKAQIVLLMPSLAEVLRRNHARGSLPGHEVEMLYTEMQNLTGYDHRIDNTDLSVEELAPQLVAIMDQPFRTKPS